MRKFTEGQVVEHVGEYFIFVRYEDDNFCYIRSYFGYVLKVDIYELEPIQIDTQDRNKVADCTFQELMSDLMQA